MAAQLLQRILIGLVLACVASSALGAGLDAGAINAAEP